MFPCLHKQYFMTKTTKLYHIKKSRGYHSFKQRTAKRRSLFFWLRHPLSDSEEGYRSTVLTTTHCTHHLLIQKDSK